MNKKLPAWVMLCVVCLVGALALGLVNGLTAASVDRQAATLADVARNRALEADHFEPLETQEGRYNLDLLYAAQSEDGTIQGYVGQTTVTGYGGPIEVNVGVDNEGVITGVDVGGSQFAETPGLGARTREAAFTDQFIGKTPTLTLNEGGVDTVTGASTTSRAVVSAVNTVANYIYLNQLGLAEETETAFMGQTFSATEQGFAGDVTVTIGFDDEGAIAYMTVDTPDETDGLGKMASEPEFSEQFIGKTGPFTYGEDGIEALTGATFTSTAAINAVNAIVNGEGEASGGPLTSTVQGFGGEVTLNVLLNDDGTVAALTIDTPDETDGLGKMTSEPEFTEQFIGKAAPFTYGEDGIEAVTGATVTSTAVIDGLNALLSGESVPAVAVVEPEPAEEEAPVEEETVAEEVPAEEALAEETAGETITVEKTTDFSTITIEATVADGKIVDAKVTSEALEGSVDMLTDEHRADFAAQMVEKQDVDAISGVTVSSEAIKEAVGEILGESSEEEAEPVEEEAPAAEETAGETITVEKTTDFSTITIEATVVDGKIVDAKVTSEALEGSVDMLTDEHRADFAAQMVEKQDVDAISGVTISSEAIKEAVGEILAQAGGEAVEEASAEEEPVAEEVPAEETAGETITVEKTTDFSTITIEATVVDGKIVDAKVTSEALEGSVDMLTDEHRADFAAQMVEKQDVDAISGVTISSEAIKEAVGEILAQAGGEAAEEEAPAEEEPVAEEVSTEEALAEETAGETITVEKTTDFSTITIEATVVDGKIVDAKVTSEALEGSVDMLTDEHRADFAAQMVEKQDVDAISGVTISSEAIKEAVAEILGESSEEEAEPVEEEAPAAEETAGETITVEKTTDFSTITIEATIADGKIVDAKVTSEALEGSVDMLTDEHRADFAAQMVEKQDVDAISGVTVSSEAIKEAVQEILGESSEEEAEPVEEEAPATEETAGETITVEKTTDFSTITIEATVADGKIVDAKVTSEALEGSVDMLMDEHRADFAAQMVEKQDVDAISGVTVSSEAIKEAVGEILAQAGGEAVEEEAPVKEELVAEEAPAEETAGETITVEKTTDFSTITIEATVADGKIVDAKVTSEALEGSVDMLTDEHRADFAAQMVEKQDVDAISGVTISSEAIKEAVAEILAQ